MMRQRASLGSGRIQHKSPRIIFNAIRGHIAYRRLRIGIFSSPNTCLPLNMLHEVALALAGLGLSTVGMTPSPSTLAPSPSESIHPRYGRERKHFASVSYTKNYKLWGGTRTENQNREFNWFYGVACLPPVQAATPGSTPPAILLSCYPYIAWAPETIMLRFTFLAALAVVACLVSSAAAFVAGGGAGLVRTSCVDGTTSAQHVQRRDAQQLRAAAGDGEEGGGFVNPYTAFRKWQMDLVSSSRRCS